MIGRDFYFFTEIPNLSGIVNFELVLVFLKGLEARIYGKDVPL